MTIKFWVVLQIIFDPQNLLIGGPRAGTKEKALVPSFRDWQNIAVELGGYSAIEKEKICNANILKDV